MSFHERPIRSFDRFQRRVPPVSFPVAVFKKYADDRGPNMGALLAFHAFVATTPLLLIFFTVLGFLFRQDPSLQRTLEQSALSDFPVLGDSLASPHLEGSVPVVVVSAVVALWGATGISRSFQNSMADIWNVPMRARLDFIPRCIQGLGFLSLLSIGVVGTAVINGVTSALKLGSAATWLLFVPTSLISVAIIAAAYRALTPTQRRWRDHLPGALLAGFGYQILQVVGVSLVTHEAKRAGEFYQTFGVVVGFLAFAYLAGQLLIVAAELNVVIIHHLWPRNLWQPPLTDADRRQLIQLALREERVVGQVIHVEFLDDAGGLPDWPPRARGGTVDTAGLNPAAERHEGSTPSAPTAAAPPSASSASSAPSAPSASSASSAPSGDPTLAPTADHPLADQPGFDRPANGSASTWEPPPPPGGGRRPDSVPRSPRSTT